MASYYEKVKIDGEVLYIKGLDAGMGYSYDKAGGIKDASNTLETALKPVVSLTKAIKNEMEKLNSDEIEMTIQLNAGVDGKNIFFGLVDINTEAQISVKSIWKKPSDREE